MSRVTAGDLRGVCETLLLPPHYRAAQYRRADALMRDERAVQIVRQLDYNFARVASTSSHQ